MPKVYMFTDAQRAEIQEARRKNKHKSVDRRLEALLLRAEKTKRAEVAKKTGFSKQYITDLTAIYQQKGLSAIVGNHYHGNCRNMSFAEEQTLLEPFKKAAESGQIVEVAEILAAYEAKLGRKVGSNSQIYYVLQRHGWRKIMPRSKHPNKASNEAIEASKKST